ncbi:phage antirepressor Ant [Erwinia sp. OLTSP20]|uniref:antA/AntB antirepressor family protein n=1 Tax=unclassified Erwinia TaxID=2622719 RepID=UPI000C18DAB0|nr:MULTISPECIES: antA/AntB antirepressor family protein [unclassified Erwinia]PIJ50650.1 phage antirepressor Ant [Erwinia sp. OAMSP11]PIJ72696.1 antirepressor [Erwinia sp. OLSSP12]PIJ83222.1 antirepressor [Erwinia sp. OLCASP19]PIJ85277.1 antirepressor [Erwinia sp. OLMTSP26]PIJ87279.1 antirepressor [Erwinia sp. OLMDSP33]
MTAQLIPVFNGDISNETVLLCNARDLHAFLGVKRDFSTWLSGRVIEYKFIKDQDYVLVPQNGGIKNGRGGDRRSKDYHLTLDTAKELAMVERNEQGRQVRRYFIECEKKLHQQSFPQAPSVPDAFNPRGLPRGVYLQKNCSKNPYRASIWRNGQHYHVGVFPTIEAAVNAQKNFFSGDKIQPILSSTEQDLFIGNLHAILHNFRRIDEIWRSRLRPALEIMDSKLVYLLHDRFNDSMCVIPTIESRIGKYIPPKLPR